MQRSVSKDHNDSEKDVPSLLPHPKVRGLGLEMPEPRRVKSVDQGAKGIKTVDGKKLM